MGAVFPRVEADPVAENDLAMHMAATTAAHGGIVATTDARLSDQRVPTDGSVTVDKLADNAVTSAKIANGTIGDSDIYSAAAIAPTKIAGTALTLAGGTLTGALLASAGTAALPPIAFAAQPSTGLFLASASDLRIIVAGSTRASITSSGLASSTAVQLTGATSQLQWTALSAASTVGLAIKVSGDANNRLHINAGGQLLWGDGTAVQDILLKRQNVNALQVRNAADSADLDFAARSFWPSAGITNALGAVGTPSYTFAGDLNTGIYSPAADEWAVATGGTLRLNISPAGAVGIGNVYGTDTLLRVGASGGQFQFSSSSTVYGITATPVNNGTGAISGIYARAQANVAGASGDLISISGDHRLAGAATAITNAKVFAAGSPTMGSGTIGTLYGVYVGKMNAVGVTTAYGVYQADAGDLNYFAGGLSTPGVIALTGGGSPAVLTARSLSSVASTMFGSRVSGDANDRFVMRADGGLAWGPGTTPVDTLLRRSTPTAGLLVIRDAADTAYKDLALNVLQIGDGTVSAPTIAFVSDTAIGIFKHSTTGIGFATAGVERASIDLNGMTVLQNINLTSSNSTLQIRFHSANAQAILTKLSADSINRFEVWTDGTMKWGTGSATPDVLLKRTAVGKLSVRNTGDTADADLGVGSVYVATQIFAPDGSLSSPSYSFTNDPNTGIYSWGADAISLVTNGAERVRINSAGNVILGGGGAGGGVRCIAVDNASTVPTTNPTTGGVLYAEGGALKWRGSSGTVTILGVA